MPSKTYREISRSGEILRVDARNGVINNKYSGDGIELIPEASRNFDSDGTSYWESNGGTISWTGDSLRITSVGGYCSIKKSILTIGKKYLISFRCKSSALTSSTFFSWANYSDKNIISSPNLSTEYQTYSCIFTQTIDTLIRIGPVVSPTDVGTTVDFDEISIQEIIPSITNTATTIQRAGSIYAMDFNGSTSKLDCGSYDTLVGDKTFVAWVKPRTWGASGVSGTMFANNQLRLGIYSSGERILFTSNESTYIFSANNSIKIGKFQLLVATRTSTGVTNFYVDGVLSGSANQSSGTPVAGSTNIFIGNKGDNTYYHVGQISQARIINGILTVNEISQLWSSERKNYNV